MAKNLTIEEFNEKVSARVLANFEAYTDGIIKNIDNIRVKMCENTRDFIRGFEEETDNVFMMAEYHQLMIDITATICYHVNNKNTENILNLLKELKEYYLNEYLNIRVNFNTTNMMHNLRKLSKVKAYQNLINIIDSQIKECIKSYNIRYEKLNKNN